MMVLKYSLWSLAFLVFATVANHMVHGEENNPGAFEQGSKLPITSSTNILWKTKNFFTPNDLRAGETRPLYFGGTYPSKRPSFLPKERADLIPFSSNQLPFLLELFGIKPNSPQAKAVEFSLRLCEKKTKEGDIAHCTTSFESMVEFVGKAFGPAAKPYKVLTTSPVPKFAKFLQNYTMVNEPTEVSSRNAVVCHVVAYPYAVFYCHYQASHTKLLQIALSGEDGTQLDAVAICHMDSYHMDPNHIAFTHFGIKHGSPVCHFVPPEELVWVPAPDQKSE